MTHATQWLAGLGTLLALGGGTALCATAAGADLAGPGLYRSAAGQPIYVGPEREEPGTTVNQYFAPRTQRTGELAADAPVARLSGIDEEPRLVEAPGGALGVSLYRSGPGKRATIILIHGNDPETRAMGFIIPYFVLAGVNVISYDQRGTGRSAGDWRHNGPVERAADVEAIYDAYAADAHVDARRLGVFGFSNGGWTAPLVATARPVAFMILKSAPAESIEANVCYSVSQHMRHRHDDARAIAAATDTWRSLIGALAGRVPWDTARARYAAASAAPWFEDSYIPYFYAPGVGLPPPAATAKDLGRALIYDPAATLERVRTPTLALFGARDRNVDVAHAPARFAAAFGRAGLRDFTVHVYPDAGHTLKVSATGFNDEPSAPERLTAGYPQIMIDWLRARGAVD